MTAGASVDRNARDRARGRFRASDPRAVADARRQGDQGRRFREEAGLAHGGRHSHRADLHARAMSGGHRTYARLGAVHARHARAGRGPRLGDPPDVAEAGPRGQPADLDGARRRYQRHHARDRGAWSARPSLQGRGRHRQGAQGHAPRYGTGGAQGGPRGGWCRRQASRCTAVARRQAGGVNARSSVSIRSARSPVGVCYPAHRRIARRSHEARQEARTTAPKLRTVCADATIYHEAGATEAYELTALASTFVAYLRAFEAAGITPTDAMGHISFAVSADTEQFLTTAKLRAARRLIWRIAEASGAAPSAPRDAHHRRFVAPHDGEARSLDQHAAHDARVRRRRSRRRGRHHRACRSPGRSASLMRSPGASRATFRSCCRKRARSAACSIPMGGSWYIETLTDELAKTAWKLFQDIEARGGIVAALGSGAVQNEIAAETATRAKAIATGRAELTGVSAFPFLGDDGVISHAPSCCTCHRGQAPRCASEPASRRRAVRGAPRRSRCPRHQAGKPPQVFLATIGEVIDHTARSTWVKNYLAAGGIAALTSDGYADATDAAAAFAKSGCLCRLHLLLRHALRGARKVDGARPKGGRCPLRADGWQAR